MAEGGQEESFLDRAVRNLRSAWRDVAASVGSGSPLDVEPNLSAGDANRIREEMRVLDENRFENRVTVTDPVYLTGPWSWTWTYQRKPDYKMYEYVCEDNREYADPATGATRLRVTERER